MNSRASNVRDFPQALHITCATFRRLDRGKLKGVCDLEIGAWNLVIRDCRLFEGNNGDFVGLPSTSYEDRDGNKHWKKLVEFSTKQAANEFNDAALAAIARFTRDDR